MKVDLGDILKSLGLPIGLIAVFSAVLLLFGINLETVLSIAGSMVGLQLLLSVLIDVLKWAGVVKDDTAGIWSAGFNLAALGVIATIFYYNPALDFPQIDAQLATIAKFLALILGYIIQMIGTKGAHQFIVRGLGVTAFSNNA